MKVKQEKENVVAVGLYSKAGSNGVTSQEQYKYAISIVSNGNTVPDNAGISGESSQTYPHNEKQNEKTADDVPTVPFSRAIITLIILLLANLLNYMDRFTVAGVLIDIREYYHDLGNSEAGIIQTAFICTYMICSPVFGYLGDRYSRKYIMSGGIFLWSAFTFASSLVPKDYFYLFVLLRALVGVGEASYSTIAPTIIADLFAKEKRTKALMIFYFAIPVGSGMGYIVGSKMADAFGGWQWALRATPILGVVCVILIVLICVDPPRGMSEEGGSHLKATGLCADIKALVKIKSYVFSSLGTTCVGFVSGAFAFLAPSFMMYATEMQDVDLSQSTVDLIFGGLTVAAGFIGVALGVELARRYRTVNPRADPLLCAFGLLTCTPFLYTSLVLSGHNTYATWVLIFLGEMLLCLNWAINADILLYVVIPTRRSLAASGQILGSHALGDAISPYILGQIADSLASHHDVPNSPAVQFNAIQNSLYLCTFICVMGGAFYLATALFVEKDKKQADKTMKDAAKHITGVTNGGLSIQTTEFTQMSQNGGIRQNGGIC